MYTPVTATVGMLLETHASKRRGNGLLRGNHEERCHAEDVSRPENRRRFRVSARSNRWRQPTMTSVAAANEKSKFMPSNMNQNCSAIMIHSAIE